MEDDSAFAYKKQKSLSSYVCDLLFSNVGLFFLVALYVFVGAMAFVELERPKEEERRIKKMEDAVSINQTLNYVAQLLWFYQANTNLTLKNYTALVNKDLKDLEGQIMASMGDHNYDGTVDGWEYSWTMSKAMLLTMTIITTIGYGHISPVTFYGQMFCIVYAIIGSPLLLLFMANIGDAMADSLTYIYSRFCCRWCRSRRYLSELPENASRRDRKQVIDDKVGDEEYMPTAKMVVPITINMVLLSAFVILGALLFVELEGWNFTSSCYFTFITISTIGYGDYYPDTAMVEDLGADFLETIKMFVVVFYLLLGMAMLSMALNLMQDQLVDKCRWLAQQIGLSKKPEPEHPPNKPAASDKNAEKNSNALMAPNNRRESVADTSVPEGLSPSAAPTRPASAMSAKLPGVAEE